MVTVPFLKFRFIHRSNQLEQTENSISRYRINSHTQDTTVLQHSLFLTLILLTWRIWWAPNNATKWQIGFNSAFKELTRIRPLLVTQNWRSNNPYIATLATPYVATALCENLRRKPLAWSHSLLNQIKSEVFSCPQPCRNFSVNWRTRDTTHSCSCLCGKLPASSSSCSWPLTSITNPQTPLETSSACLAHLSHNGTSVSQKYVRCSQTSGKKKSLFEGPAVTGKET